MKKQLTNQRGSAILTVLGIVAVVSVVCAMLGLAASQQSRSSQITREMLKARMIAESGLNKAYHAVKENFSLAKGYKLSESFGGGTYSVRSGRILGESSNRAQLISEGACGMMGKATVSVDLENRPLTTEDDDKDTYFDLLFNLLVGGTLDLQGTFHAEVDAIQANGNATISGNADPGTQVSSAGTVTWKKADGSITLLSNQSPVEVLSEALLAAIQAFKDFATENGAVYSSGSEIPASPPGGVAYCTGSDAGWSGQGTGCFIFEGDVSLQGRSLNVSSVNGYPALIVLSASEVHLNAGTVVHGALIIPSASVKINGHAAIYGAILVGQSMTGNGTADLFAGDGPGFNLPPEAEQTDNVVITAWH
jgi:hypothetical protein